MDQITKLATTVVASTTAAAAQTMAAAAYLPLHLKGKVSRGGKIERGDEFDDATIIATCSALIAQAESWDINPMSLANESYSVHGRLGYQGKVLAGIVHKHAKTLIDGLAMLYEGEGDGLVGLCFGHTREPTEEVKKDLQEFVETGNLSTQNRLTLAGCKTYRVTRREAQSDNALWQTDPEQKLYYTAAVRWCRRYTPQILLGAITDEEVDYLARRDDAYPPRPKTMKALIESNTPAPTPKPEDTIADEPKPKPARQPKPPLDASDPMEFRSICVDRFGKCDTPDNLKKKYTAARKAVNGGKILPPPNWENICDKAMQDRLYIICDPDFEAGGGEE